MRFIYKNRAVIAFCMALFCQPVFATNGAFLHGITLAEKALAGAGIANPTSALSIDANPSSLALIGDNNKFILSYFAVDIGFSSEGLPSAAVGTVCGIVCPFSIGSGDLSLKSGKDSAMTPSFAMSRRIDEQSVWGMAIVVKGGMATEWKGSSALLGPGVTAEHAGIYGDGDTLVELRQVYLSTTYARQFSEKLSLGFSLIYNYQTFEMAGLGQLVPFSLFPDDLNDRGMDDSSGLGFKLGVLYKVNKKLSLGGYYQPKTNMDKFSDYRGLFAHGGELDLPSNFGFGSVWRQANGNKILFDIQWIKFTDLVSLSNPFSNLVDGSCSPGFFGGAGEGCLGGARGAGFGWENMTVYKLGYEVALANKAKLRFGFSATEQPVPSTEMLLNILAPGVVENHITLGFSALDKDGKGWEVSAMLALENSVSGTNAFDSNQTISIEMAQWELAVGYGY